MFKLISFVKKFALIVPVLVIGLAALPTNGIAAATLQDPISLPANSTRFEKVWVRMQTVYHRQGDRLAKSSELITRVQTLIDKANQKGWDTSTIQAKLDAFASVIPAVQTAHDPGAAIIANHNGFDANGKVADRSIAVATVKSLGQVLKDTRAAMNGTGQELREAIKAFRDAHKSAMAP
jgi:ABC-type transporter Mla subunit MlaD